LAKPLPPASPETPPPPTDDFDWDIDDPDWDISDDFFEPLIIAKPAYDRMLEERDD